MRPRSPASRINRVAFINVRTPSRSKTQSGEMDVGSQTITIQEILFQVQSLFEAERLGLLQRPLQQSVEDLSHLLGRQPMGKPMDFALGRDSHLVQGVDQTKPLIERIAGQLTAEPSVILLEQRPQDGAVAARERGSFDSISMANFFHRIAPNGEEIEAMVRVGAFDEFGEARTRQFWQAQHLVKTYGASVQSKQGWLIPPPGLEQLPAIPLNEPCRRERLQSETRVFSVSPSAAIHSNCSTTLVGIVTAQ